MLHSVQVCMTKKEAPAIRPGSLATHVDKSSAKKTINNIPDIVEKWLSLSKFQS